MNEGTHDARRLSVGRSELIETMRELITEDGVREMLPGVYVARVSHPTEARTIHDPAFCFIVQGRKQATLGDETFWYDPGRYLIFTVDLPLLFKIDHATPEEPYIGLRIDLDPKLVASVMMEAGGPSTKSAGAVSAIDATPVDADLLDVVVRLVRLMKRPDDRAVMTPMLMKELVYRLLAGGQSGRLAHMLSQSGEAGRISKAVSYLRRHFDQPLRIESLARELGMSVSGFHHHFKAVTAMSPLQFQKQIRLQEARTLMLGGDLDAATAGFRVGYEDPAYFSRDYKKLFGEPPQRDIARLRGELTAAAEA